MNNENDFKFNTAEFFNKVAPIYDQIGPRSFTHFGKRLVELAQISEGDSILDIASGRGAVLFPAAKHTGPQGNVTGIDLSDEMIRITSEEISKNGFDNVKVCQMDAECLDLPDDSFNQVLCGFGIFFFPDIQSVLSEFLRVLKPDGNIGVSVFSKDGEYFQWFQKLVMSFMINNEISKIEMTPLKLYTSSELEGLFKNAGFKDVHIKSEDATFIHKDEDEFWSSLWSHGARHFLDQLTPELLENFKNHFYKEIQDIKHSDGFHMPSIEVLSGFESKQGSPLTSHYFLYSDGVLPVTFLKTLLKVTIFSNPTEKAISIIFELPAAILHVASLMRRLLIYSLIVLPV